MAGSMPAQPVPPPKADRVAAVRNEANRIVIVGVISDDLSDQWVRVRAHDGCSYAVAKADLVFLDKPL